MTTFRYLSVCVVLLLSGQAECRDLTAFDILDKVQRRYGSGDFTAEFVQETHLKAVDMVDTATGQLYYRHPGMMRWHYKTPEEHLIITDGETVWLYRPAENQVMLGRAPDYFGWESAADFFTKPGELSGKFMVELAPAAASDQGLHVLRLLPRDDRSNLAELNLYISKEGFDIVRAVTRNTAGDRTTIAFSGYAYSRGLDLSLFVFQIPKGADVVVLDGHGLEYEQ